MSGIEAGKGKPQGNYEAGPRWGSEVARQHQYAERAQEPYQKPVSTEPRFTAAPDGADHHGKRRGGAELWFGVIWGSTALPGIPEQDSSRTSVVCYQREGGREQTLGVPDRSGVPLYES